MSWWFKFGNAIFNCLQSSSVCYEGRYRVAWTVCWAWACSFFCLIRFLFILAFAELDLLIHLWLSMFLMPIADGATVKICSMDSSWNGKSYGKLKFKKEGTNIKQINSKKWTMYQKSAIQIVAAEEWDLENGLWW